MILIYSPEENSRITWAFDLIFRQLLGLDYRLTTFPEEIIHSDGPRLNYSFRIIPGVPFIEASGLLFEREIRDQSARLIPGQPWAGLPTICTTGNNQSDLPFDLFSAIFFFTSRYEEYLPYEPDQHHRFRSTESLAYHLDILGQPIVNQWVIAFRDTLESWYPGALSFHPPAYRFIPTIDVDNAWAYAHKGIRRTIGGLWRDRRNMEARNFRFQVIRNNQPDPYNTYELLNHFHSMAGVEPFWFFLVGSYGHFDKNISPENTHLQSLIQGISEKHTVGLHPSYASNSSHTIIGREAERLSHIIGRPVTCSRQHYLRIHLPETYRALAHLGIRADYSMGYADCPGFRAGIASPFQFFDLEENKITDLTIYPFQVMDTSLQRYLRLDPDQAISKIAQLVNQVRAVGGTFISLWHNESLSEWKNWRGWSKVYQELLNLAKPE